ncbi:MAG: response regulator [Actinomycetota bacterium]
MPLTILVADDDFATRLAIGDYLEVSGYSVIVAENGQEALALVEKYQPHLIVTDITMPEMDGYEFVRRVRASPAFRLLPVIFLTERTTTEERIRGYQMGCDNYLPKPFELKELGVVIRSLLERYALIAQAGSFMPRSESQRLQSEERSQSVASSELSLPVSETESIASNAAAVTASLIARINLTQRELEVLELLTGGLSNAQIGDRLHLSPRTVEKYVSSLLRKTESNNRAELVRFAMEHHLVN